MSDTENKGYEDIGGIPIDRADDGNIPVDIWLLKGTENDKYPGKWMLEANNYMPRRGRLSGGGSYRAISEDRAVLVGLVHKHWLPLYRNAVSTLEAMNPDSDDKAYLYYWKKP